MTPMLGGHWGRWPATGTALQKSEMEQIYAYNFVKKGYFRLLTLFLKYYPLDKHFKHNNLDQFLIIYSILRKDMDNIILLHKC